MVTRDQGAAVRLAPRWAVLVVAALGPFCLLVGLLLTAGSTGTDRAVALAYVVLGAAATVAGALGLWPRRPSPPQSQAGGATTWSAPALLVGAVLVGWLAVVVLVVLLVMTVVTGGVAALERPGAALVLAAVAVATLPDVVRLALGRLHRWRFALGPAGVSYRGYRTRVEVPWSRVRGAHLQASRLVRWGAVPARMRPEEAGHRGYGLVIEVAGKGPDVLVPQFFLRVRVEQLLAEVERARVAAR